MKSDIGHDNPQEGLAPGERGIAAGNNIFNTFARPPAPHTRRSPGLISVGRTRPVQPSKHAG